MHLTIHNFSGVKFKMSITQQGNPNPNSLLLWCSWKQLMTNVTLNHIEHFKWNPLFPDCFCQSTSSWETGCFWRAWWMFLESLRLSCWSKLSVELMSCQVGLYPHEALKKYCCTYTEWQESIARLDISKWNNVRYWHFLGMPIVTLWCWIYFRKHVFIISQLCNVSISSNSSHASYLPAILIPWLLMCSLSDLVEAHHGIFQSSVERTKTGRAWPFQHHHNTGKPSPNFKIAGEKQFGKIWLEYRLGHTHV